MGYLFLYLFGKLKGEWKLPTEWNSEFSLCSQINLKKKKRLLTHNWIFQTLQSCYRSNLLTHCAFLLLTLLFHLSPMHLCHLSLVHFLWMLPFLYCLSLFPVFLNSFMFFLNFFCRTLHSFCLIPLHLFPYIPLFCRLWRSKSLFCEQNIIVVLFFSPFFSAYSMTQSLFLDVFFLLSFWLLPSCFHYKVYRHPPCCLGRFLAWHYEPHLPLITLVHV